jgi:hypothetical protein
MRLYTVRSMNRGRGSARGKRGSGGYDARYTLRDLNLVDFELRSNGKHGPVGSALLLSQFREWIRWICGTAATVSDNQR